MAQIKPTFYWQAQQWADWLQSELIGQDSKITGVNTDSRTTRPGDAYFALVGERFDGHQFALAAERQEASLLVLERKMPLSISQLVVADTRLALGQIAKQHRLSQSLEQALAAVIAVTGSNGKTTVKEMLAHILASQAPTLATVGNLNNDFGVPRTLLEIRPEHQYAVIEMGANHPAEIDYLTHLTCPDVAVITLAAGAHLEGFGSLQGVIDAKGEIFNGLTSAGTGVINTDSVGYQQWNNQLVGRNVIRFGRAKEADVQVLDIQGNEQGLAFTFNLHGKRVSGFLPMLGEHNVMNAAAATAASLAVGLTWAEIQPALASFKGVDARLQTYQLIDQELTQSTDHQAWLIDDSYNANPNSVKAAIDTLSTRPGYKVFCLGQMAELGEQAEQAHFEIGAYAQQKKIDCLLTYGELTAASQQGFAAQSGQVAAQLASHQAMVDQLIDILSRHSSVTILIKGSRSAQMECVVQPILTRFKHAHLS